MARQIVVEIVGDASKFNKATKDAVGSSSKLKDGIKQGLGIGAGLGVVGIASQAFGVLTDAIGGSIQAASDLQQATGAVESVFGKTSTKIMAFADTAAKSIGLSKAEVSQMAAVMGAQLQSVGFSTDEAADKTLELQERAADMAATFGGTTKDAIEAISSLMRGETDPIEKYGVAIKESTVKAAVAAKVAAMQAKGASIEQVSAYLKTAMAVERVNLLMQQTQKTSGQFARESGTLAGQQQILSAQMENTGAQIGQKLMPVMAGLMQFANDTLIPALMVVADVFGQIWDAIMPIVKAIADALIPVIKKLLPIFQQVFGAIGDVIKALAPAFEVVFGVIATVIGAWVESLMTAVKVVVEIVGTIAKAFEGLGKVVNGIFKAIGGIIRGVINAIIGVINSVIRGINSFRIPKIEIAGQVIFGGWGGLNLRQIPRFHQGGVVPGSPGTEVLTMLQAGETVTPAGGAGQTIIIRIDSFIGSDSDIDRFADKVALRLRSA